MEIGRAFRRASRKARLGPDQRRRSLRPLRSSRLLLRFRALPPNVVSLRHARHGRRPRNSDPQRIDVYLGRVLPGSASDLVDQVVTQTTQASGGGKLSFGILLALWSASAGVVAMMNGLNAVYEVKETRSLIKTRAIALALTIGLSVLVISALAVILYGGTIAKWVGNLLHMGSAFTITWSIVQWPVAIFFL